MHQSEGGINYSSLLFQPAATPFPRDISRFTKFRTRNFTGSRPRAPLLRASIGFPSPWCEPILAPTVLSSAPQWCALYEAVVLELDPTGSASHRRSTACKYGPNARFETIRNLPRKHHQTSPCIPTSHDVASAQRGRYSPRSDIDLHLFPGVLCASTWLFFLAIKPRRGETSRRRAPPCYQGQHAFFERVRIDRRSLTSRLAPLSPRAYRLTM